MNDSVIPPGVSRAIAARTIYRLENYVKGGLYRAGVLELMTDLEVLRKDCEDRLKETG